MIWPTVTTRLEVRKQSNIATRARRLIAARACSNEAAAVPAPLAIDTLRLAGDRNAKGFLVEADAVAGARDVSSFGG